MLRYVVGFGSRWPASADSFAVLSIGVGTMLQFSMSARSRISSVYCCWLKNRPEAFGVTLIPRKWCNSPMSVMANSALRELIM